MAEPVELDAARQAEARRYSAESRRWMLAELALSLFLLLLFLLSGASARLADWASRVSSGNPWLTIAFYGAVLLAGYTLLTLPLSYLSGFRLPHRYGMSNQSAGEWAADQAKGLVLTALFGGLVVEVIDALLRWQPGWWWLWAALFLLFVTVLLGQLAPVLILPLFY